MNQQTAEFVEENDEPEDDSVAASIDAAWEAHDRGDDEPDEGGEGEVDPAPESEPEPDTEEEGTQPEKDTSEKAVSKDKDGGVDPDKPPVGLSPAAREAWKQTPPALKAEIAKREKDYAIGLQKNAEWANRARQMDQVLDPYKAFLSTNGGAAAIPAVLERAMTLQMGTPTQRAQAAADIINQFGVDINQLDDILSGQAPAPSQQQPMSENEQWLQQFRQEQEQQRLQQQNYQQEQINQGVGAFLNDPAHEFASDVSEEMADLLEMAARRGVIMSLDQAYERACQIRPDIAQLVNGRKSTQSVNKRRNAASSIHGSPNGETTRQTGDNLRSAIEAAFDSVGQV